MRHTTALLSTAALAALTLTGCAQVVTVHRADAGGAPREAVVAAALATGASGTAKVTLDLRGGSGADAVTVSVEGRIALDGSRADLTATLPKGTLGSDAPLHLHELVVAKKAYLSVDGVSPLPGLMPDLWISTDVDGAPGAAGLGSLAATGGVGPLLDALRSVTTVSELGPQQVGGVLTTHYRASISASSLLGSLGGLAPGGSIPGLPSGAVPRLPTDAAVPVDVWVDGSGRLVGLTAALDSGAAPAASARLTFADFGAPLQVSAPAGALDLSGLLGG
jgi:hypothetical protein